MRTIPTRSAGLRPTGLCDLIRLRRAHAAGALSLMLASGAAGSDFEMALTVREPGESARNPALTTTGIPFERGALRDVANLSVSLDGRRLPAQFRAHVPWDDGSVRWALMDAQVPVEAGSTVRLTVRNDGGNPAPDTPVRVTEDDDRIRVANGAIEFALSKTKGGLFEYADAGERRLTTGAGRGLVLELEDGRAIVAGAPLEAVVEEAGPLRAVVRVRGVFAGIHEDRIRYTARVTAWAGQPRIQVRLWLENHGALGIAQAKPEWLAFRSMTVELGLGLGERIAAACEDVQAENRLRVLQRCLPAKGRTLGRGEPGYAWDDFEYVMTGGDENQALAKGARTDGVLELRGEHGRLVAAVREFWQNYDKAIGVKNGLLRIELWPEEGQWPRQRAGGWRGVRDPFLRQTAEGNSVYRYPGSLRKGHEFALDFCADRSRAEIAAELQTPLYALASAERYARTRAAPEVFAPPEFRVENHAEAAGKFAAWERRQRNASDPDHPSGLLAGRRAGWRTTDGSGGDPGHAYGWMDFGDVGVPVRGQAGAEDWAHMMFLNAMRFGDVHAMKLGSQMARHTADIDQHWSDRDPPRYSAVQKVGTVSPVFHVMTLTPNSIQALGVGNRLSGLALHHMLTGDPLALEACLRYGEGLREAWKASSRMRSWRGMRVGGNEGHTFSAYGALYKLTADETWRNEAMALFQDRIMGTLRERHGPLLYDPDSVIRLQSYRRYDQAYCQALQDLCELHMLTGNAQVRTLLEEGCAAEFDEDLFFTAPLYRAGLFAYVGHLTGNEDYAGKALDMLVRSFPETRDPPVFSPHDNAWHDKHASLVRSGHLLHYVLWQSSQSDP